MDAGRIVVPPPPLLQLDYARQARRSPFGGDRVVMAVIAAVCGLIGVAIFGLTIETLFNTWPDFGMTLVAVPAGVVATAFGQIAVTAAKLAVRDG